MKAAVTIARMHLAAGSGNGDFMSQFTQYSGSIQISPVDTPIPTIIRMHLSLKQEQRRRAAKPQKEKY